MTQVPDAIAATEVGVDAIGLVFHPPVKRNISIEQAKEIVKALPPFVTPVALFVDAEPCRIVEVARLLGIRHVQLHGNESPERVAELRELTVIKALRVDPRVLSRELQIWREAIDRLKLVNLHAFVLETNTKQAGGTGVENDWEAIREHQLRGEFAGLPPIIVAGGLRPENVAGVVRMLHPYAVDVSSGIENAPGEKSKEKMTAFVNAVRDIG